MASDLIDARLHEVVRDHVREGTLYERRPDGRLICFACGHRCLIPEGRAGVCRVRFNEGGRLMVPWGYVGGIQLDPIEKKPFFHAYPGSTALSFGMLGCDLHCGYCFPGDTPVVTDHGPVALEEAFRCAARVERTPDAEIASPEDLRAVAASGTLRKVRAIFKHRYRGPLTVVRPYYLPPLRCAPDHRIYATADPAEGPQPVQARELEVGHWLAIPRRYDFSAEQVIDVLGVLADHQVAYRVPWGLSVGDREAIADATARGETSQRIGGRLGKSASYVRPVRVKLARGLGQDLRTGRPCAQDGTLRFPNERRPGIPLSVPLNEDMARLLGYYCAEGSVVQGRNRPNSYTLNFSFSPPEAERAEDVRGLLERLFGIRSALVRRETTLAVAAGKASAALLFKSLAGARAATKRVPGPLFDAHRAVVEAFVDTYIACDGHRYGNGKVTVTTVSWDLAYGSAWLALKLGFLPSIYEKAMPVTGTILGRTVRLSSRQFTVVWYENACVKRRVIQTERYYLVPIREVSTVDYDGDVYNMEVEEEHNYLAGFFLVSNCQNWLTSQSLRDPKAVAPVMEVEPEQIADLAVQHGARVVTSTYNEPLITSEWAMAVFEAARRRGLVCSFVSNGNATPEVLDYLRPMVRLYKVDLKSFDDRHYRQLGGRLEPILESIRGLVERGFWVEVVTLIVPGFNDSEVELREIARFLARVSPDIPWHVTAFHSDYKMMETPNTSVNTLLRAYDIGREEGLRYVYPGNAPGRVGERESTFCPHCSRLLIRRIGFMVLANHLRDGCCPGCGAAIPGVWE